MSPRRFRVDWKSYAAVFAVAVAFNFPWEIAPLGGVFVKEVHEEHMVPGSSIQATLHVQDGHFWLTDVRPK